MARISAPPAFQSHAHFPIRSLPRSAWSAGSSYLELVVNLRLHNRARRLREPLGRWSRLIEEIRVLRQYEDIPL